MGIGFGMSRNGAEIDAASLEESGAVKVLVQLYRCPEGHLNDIVWTAPEMAIACEVNDIQFYCARCRAARFASEAEARSLLAAFGLAPSLRIYSS
ncbi:MAG TPA: hypothetical protein VLS49_07465 [Usitatibacter sp.]|nr:hypothetical protein [Usitatibacter sp.]